MNNKTNHFDPDVAFLNLPIVRRVFSAIAAISMLCALLILGTTTAEFQWNSNGLDNFIQLYKVPLGVLASAIPFIAVLAANHRSEQTKQQMELTRNQIARTDKQIEISHSQNRFSNYFKHLEEFHKRFTDFSLDIYSAGDLNHTHHVLFPKAKLGDFTIPLDVIEDFRNEVIGFIGDIYLYRRSGHWNTASIRVMSRTRRIAKEIGLNRTGQSGVRISAPEGTFTFPATTVQSFLLSQTNLFVAVETLMSFDSDYIKDPRIAELISINPNLPKDEVGNHRTPFDLTAYAGETVEIASILSSLEKSYDSRDELTTDAARPTEPQLILNERAYVAD